MRDIPELEEVAKIVPELTDNQLKAEIESLDAEGVLKRIFVGIEEAFLPEAAVDVTALIRFDIATDEGERNWTIAIDNGECRATPGGAEGPRVIVKIAIADFVRMVVGQVDPAQLFSNGNLEVGGDMMFAMQALGFFRRDF
ncbi:MAG: SCP2 sterol-binding domain-containing protein [Acidimicrobiia bacterium]